MSNPGSKYSYEHTILLREMLSLLDAKDPIQSISARAYDFWQSPLIVYDTSFKRIACSPQFTAEDKRVAKGLSAGYMQQEAIDLLSRQNRLQVYYSDQPYMITYPESIDKRYRISGQGFGYVDIPVRAQGMVIGMLAMPMLQRRPEPEDAECLLEISRLVSLVLQRDRNYMYKVRDRYEILFRDILSGSLSDSETIHARLAGLGRNVGHFCRIVVTELPEANTEVKNLKNNFLQASIRDLISGAITAYHDDQVIFLLTGDQPTIESISDRVVTFFRLNNLKAGISREFTDLAKIRQHYETAQAALRIGMARDPSETCYYYDDFYLLHELELAGSMTDIRFFCDPKLLRLAEKGRKTDIDLLQTLYDYLVLSKDWELICDKLHIHKSTLFYRIRRLREELDADLNDGREIYRIMHSFQIMEAEGLFIPDKS